MKGFMIVLLLVGVSASFAMPTDMPSTTVSPKPTLKDAVRMLLESSQLLQTWGNTVLDTSETGLNAANVQQLMSAGADARKRFHETVIEISDMLKEDEDEDGIDTFHKDVAEGAVEMLKEASNLEVFTEDEKLALISGDKLATDTMRLRINMHLFTRSMEVLDDTVSGLEDLLEDDVTDSDITAVLPEVVEMLGSEGTALGMVFKAVEESFDDAADYVTGKLDEEVEVDDDVKEDKDMEEEDDGDVKNDDDDDATMEVDDATKEVDDVPSRQRRSPRRSSSSTFGLRSGSTFGRGSSSSSFGRRGSSSSFGRRSGSSFSRDLGNGWSVGLGGVTWSSGNTRFNVGPTFKGGSPGVQAGIRIKF